MKNDQHITVKYVMSIHLFIATSTG